MMQIQLMIKEHGIEKTNAILDKEYFIKVKEYPDFYFYNYDQIFSPKSHPLVRECRSLILDKNGNVVSRAFPRFFNYGEQPDITEKFVWKDSVHYLKEDGSLIKVYWNPFDKRWEISTRSSAFGEAPHEFFNTFREAVIKDGLSGMHEQDFQRFMDLALLDKDYTYVFEYTSPSNRIVTPYKTASLVLIGCFSHKDNKEVDVDTVWYCSRLKNHTSIRLVQQFKFNSEEELKIGLLELSDGLREGFVSLDSTGLRVKHKNSLYVKLHQTRGDDGFTRKKIAGICAIGEEDEVLRYYPECEELFIPYIEARNRLFFDAKQKWNEARNIETQKDFALQVKDFIYAPFMFSMRKNLSTFEDEWNNYRMDNRAEMIIKYKELYDEIFG